MSAKVGKLVSLEDMGVQFAPPEYLTQKEIQFLTEGAYDELTDYIRNQSQWRILSFGGAQSNIPWDTELDEYALTREGLVKRCRLLARKEPLSKNAVRMYSSYLGIQKVAFKATGANAEVAEEIWRSLLWEYEENKSVLSPVLRRKLSNRILTDGELFITVGVDPLGDDILEDDLAVRIRTIDPLQFPTDGIVTHPNDVETVLYYKRVIPAQMLDRKSIAGGLTVYYRDWRVSEDMLLEANRISRRIFRRPVLPKGSRIADELLYHLPLDPFGFRGNGLLFASASYSENYRDFLQNRMAVVKGLAAYIRRVTVQGGSQAVSDVASRLRSSFSTGVGTISKFDSNSPDSAASTWVQNEPLKMENITPLTGASDAQGDNRIFRGPIAAGTGLTEPNLSGDPSIGNLASQTQMEGPMLQNFLDYQQLWEAAFTELWEFVLLINGISTEGLRLTISLPPVIIVPSDIVIANLKVGLDEKLITREAASREYLKAMKISDIDKVMADLEIEKEEEEAAEARRIAAGEPSGETETRTETEA